MILGLMQPYLFPYIGYFELIFRVDQWVVFDLVNFSAQSWMTRNRMLHPEKGWQYIKCRVNKAPDQEKISEVTLFDFKSDGQKIMRQLSHYSGKAPYYRETMEVVARVFTDLPSNSLTALNVRAMSAVCAYLGVAFNPIIASKADFQLPPIEYAGQWALEICTLLGADMYINPPGGKAIFRPDEFRARDIRLAFTRLNDFRYECPGYTFEPHLSILDVMMWNSPEEIRRAFTQEDLEYAWSNAGNG